MIVEVTFYSSPKTAPRALINPRAQGIGGGRAVGPQEKDPLEEVTGSGYS
ncbi:MAG: hypothetical protein HWN65_11175 [Candidatus Helarchaeota archaeon]|nr:hypothetical protein [Candidatus Helarchaeota archaeon]